MTVEYSPGYIAAAQAKLDALEKSMTPQAWAVASQLSFPHTSQRVSPKPYSVELEVALAAFYKACRDHDLAQELKK